MTEYYSEHGQDKYLNENVFRNKREGVFVEFGAIDGLITSNTLFFERELGWTGLLLEPIPSMAKKIKENRNCDSECVAVSDKKGTTNFTHMDCGLVGWSGIDKTIEPLHSTRIKKHIPQENQKRIRVKTDTLENILKRNHIHSVDYMTIDVEGGEWKIITSFPWEDFDIKVVDIEDNYETYDIQSEMEKHGYRKIAHLEINHIFLKEGCEYDRQ